MPFDFTGKKILITGAGRGIGRELAKAISKNGGEVYALSVTKENLDSLVKESERIHPVLANLGNWDETRAAVEKLEAMDGVVNNAGVSYPWESSLDVSKELLDKTLNINLLAAINIIQVTGKKMVAAGKGGSIVNISSVNGLNAMRECMAYNVSKAGLDMVTKQYALELGPHQIRVNSINPTVVLTDMGREHWSEPTKAAKLLLGIPMGRFVELQECIDPIMYLLSDHSKMVSGTLNPVEGGLMSNIIC